MHIETKPASPAAAAMMEEIFAKRMASALLSGDSIDLDDDIACIIRLGCCKFGTRLIAALLPQAQEIARERHAIATRGLH